MTLKSVASIPGLPSILLLIFAGLNFRDFRDFKKNPEIKDPRKKVLAKNNDANFNTLHIIRCD